MSRKHWMRTDCCINHLLHYRHFTPEAKGSRRQRYTAQEIEFLGSTHADRTIYTPHQSGEHILDAETPPCEEKKGDENWQKISRIRLRTPSSSLDLNHCPLFQMFFATSSVLGIHSNVLVNTVEYVFNHFSYFFCCRPVPLIWWNAHCLALCLRKHMRRIRMHTRNQGTEILSIYLDTATQSTLLYQSCLPWFLQKEFVCYWSIYRIVCTKLLDL